MVWSTFVLDSSQECDTLYRFILFVTTLLMILLTTFQSPTKKSPLYSQFTLPPVITTSPLLKNNCNTHLVNIENAIHCFERKLFHQAQVILNQTKQNAIRTRNSHLLLKSHLYLALIAIEKDKIPSAQKSIQHIFFLHPNFNLDQYGRNKKKYLSLFQRIKKQGRRLNEIEVNDITKKKFIRVISCKNNNHCKNNVWLDTIAYRPENSFNSDLDCSLSGNCDSIIDDNIDCSITGDCDTDLDCSLDGTC